MKRTYSKAFKIKACELVTKDNMAVAVVAEKFGIHHVMLHRWVSEYRELGEEAFVGKGHQKTGGCRASQIAQRKRTLKDGERNLKKSSGILCKRPGERVRFAKKELTECDTGIVCEVLRVSRSTFYRASKTKESEEIELEKAVIHCFEKHKGNYGRIRIKKALERQGINVSENKISRILKEHGLKAKSGRSGHNSAPKPTEEQLY